MRQFEFRWVGAVLITLCDGSKLVQIGTVGGELLGREVQPFGASHEKIRVSQWQWPVPVTLEGKNALQLQEVFSLLRCRILAKNMLAQPLLKVGEGQCRVVAELAARESLNAREQRTIG